MRYNQVGGIMISPLDMDDFSGTFCTGNVYPLLDAIHSQLLAPLPSKPREVKRKPPATKATTTTTTMLAPTFASSTTMFATSTNLNSDIEMIPINPPSRGTSSRKTIKPPTKTIEINEKTMNTGANDLKKIKESYQASMSGTIGSVRDTKINGKTERNRIHLPDITTNNVREPGSSKALPKLTTLDSILENKEPKVQSEITVPEFVSKLPSPGSSRSSSTTDYAKDGPHISEKHAGKSSFTQDSILVHKETEGQTEESNRVPEPVSDSLTLIFDQSYPLASNATTISENITERASFVSEKTNQVITSLKDTRHEIPEIVSQPMFTSSTEFTNDGLSDRQSSLSGILSNEPAKDSGITPVKYFDTAQTSPPQLKAVTALPTSTEEMISTNSAFSTSTYSTTSLMSSFNIPKIPFPNFPPKGKLSKTEPVNDIELQELLRKASDLPSHSLFEGIMKVLGKSNFPDPFERTTASSVPQVFRGKNIITATEPVQKRFMETNNYIPRQDIPQSQFRRPFIAPLKKN